MARNKTYTCVCGREFRFKRGLTFTANLCDDCARKWGGWHEYVKRMQQFVDDVDNSNEETTDGT